jgi:transketolase
MTMLRRAAMTTSTTPDIAELARQIRIDAVRATAAATAGHPTSAASAADLIAVLAARHFRYDVSDPDNPGNDRFILSKGHASTLLYAWLKAMGVIDDAELLTYGKLGSRLEGHPRPLLPWVDVATGSLGQGIAAGVGIALSQRLLENSPARTFMLCGDSEMAEGSCWEALEHASFYGLENYVVIIDVNGLGQRGETMYGHDTSVFARRAEAFGCHGIEIDGHDLGQIDDALNQIGTRSGQPTVIVARTLKGKGLGDVEAALGQHGRPLADPEFVLTGLGMPQEVTALPLPAPSVQRRRLRHDPPTLPSYDLGAIVATRLAYGEALLALGRSRDDIVVLDAETSNSTYAELFKFEIPDRYFEMYIAEQAMVAAATGLAARGWNPFTSTFASFTTRAFEFVRMSAVGGAAIRLCGSHGGLTPGESGPSAMAMEDVACFRTIPGASILQPCDATSAAQLTLAMADAPGFAYLRTARSGSPVIYPPGESFEIGGSRVLTASDSDDVTILASGTTVHPALAAADLLKAEGVAARVVDVYSIKPIDTDTVVAAARDTGLLLTAEDHFAEGGLGGAVAEALAESGVAVRLVRLAIPSTPLAAPVDVLMTHYGLDAEGIAASVRKALAG